MHRRLSHGSVEVVAIVDFQVQWLVATAGLEMESH